MQKNNFSLGMIGLGTMGRNLLLNMAGHGFHVAGYDKDPSKVALLAHEGQGLPVKGFESLQEFVESLKNPRTVMLLVPAGKIVDLVIAELMPLLGEGDIIIDGGNSHFTDTDRRVEELKARHIHFFGMGVSGGEEGARHGPSMMPGGDREAYEFVKPILESIAARANGNPCVTYIGPGSSGHFVKMVHNGIEYGLMQLIAETYELLSKGLQMPDEKIQALFDKWNGGRLQSFLMEITAHIFSFREKGAGHILLNDIRDEARAKGTGKWTSQVAMDLETPLSVIDTAVSMRDLSKHKALRVQAASVYGENPPSLDVHDKGAFSASIEEALYFSMIITYAQGMHLLYQASAAYGYQLRPEDIAAIWKGGCIIRSAFLDDIYRAYHKNRNLEHLLLDEHIATLVRGTVRVARSVVARAATSGVAIPAYAASLSYFDTFRSRKMPSNLIQAQRDYFGAHTYERTDREGFVHTDWTPEA